MLKRTLFFTNHHRLSLKDKQMYIRQINGEVFKTIPIEDIGFVVLDHCQINITLPLLEALVANNVAVVFCNSKHMPQSMLLNLDGHNIQTEIFRKQSEATLPLKKTLWKQTVEAKITNQALLLKSLGKEYLDLKMLSKKIKSGDTSNKEGAAARIYWSRLFGSGFVRDRFGSYPNDFLNYGYIILRSAVARALTGSGLLPTLGIHHRNKYNAYCLADDIMEPYRSYVDKMVYDIYTENHEVCFLDTNMKARLLKILTEDVTLAKSKRPLMIALSQSTASLAKCFAGEARQINYPVFR